METRKGGADSRASGVDASAARASGIGASEPDSDVRDRATPGGSRPSGMVPIISGDVPSGSSPRDARCSIWESRDSRRPRLDRDRKLLLESLPTENSASELIRASSRLLKTPRPPLFPSNTVHEKRRCGLF